MAFIWINGKRFIPAPYISISKDIVFAGDGRPINSNHTISLQGTLLPHKGSPSSTAGWYTGVYYPADENISTVDAQHNALIIKQDQIREEFSRSSLQLIWEPSGLTRTIMYPKLVSINFVPDTFVIKSNYEITMQASKIDRVGSNEDDAFGTEVSGLFLTAANDTYAVSERDDGTGVREVNRTITASANTSYFSSGISTSGGIYGGEAWKNAKSWVLWRYNNMPLLTGESSLGIPGTGNYYNLIRTETIDKFGGSYALSLRYLFSSGNYFETRQVSKTFDYNVVGDGGPDIVRISVNGTIQGLDTNNNNINKLANARTYYNSIVGGLPSYVGAYGREITISNTEDISNGTINYSLSYTNISGNLYKHGYNASYQIGNQGTPQVTIQGQIEGFLLDGFSSNGSSHKFNNAISGWNAISPTLKSLAFAYTQIFPTGAYYSDLPVTKSLSFDKPNGVINYNYTYGFVGSGNAGNLYTDEYQIQIDSPNSPANPSNAGLLVNASIQGTIAGLSNSTFPEDTDLKYQNARDGWNSTVRSLLYTRVANEATLIGSGPALHSGFITRSISTNKFAGTISYSASFNNFKAPTHSAVAVEDVRVEDRNANDIFAVQIIPGRAAGPIIQNIATTNERQRNINVALTLFSSGGNYWFVGRSLAANYASGLITGYLPTGVRTVNWWLAGDSETWDPKNGLYTKSISIVY